MPPKKNDGGKSKAGKSKGASEDNEKGKKEAKGGTSVKVLQVVIPKFYLDKTII